jgi:hypothetical protein
MNAQVGTPAYPPNASVDQAGQVMSAQPWDYTNLVTVLSGANRWIAYPDLSAKPRDLNCVDWACTNEGFQYWFARHIPHGDGLAPSGSCVNWWQYIADPKLELEPCCGEDCHPLAQIGQACASDDECASGHCACAGKAVCVNEAVEPCGHTNWALCATDDDCESKICGCANSNLPQCLPVGSRSGCN